MELDGKQMHRVKIGGRLNFSSLTKDAQEAIKIRLAEKDPMIKDSLNEGALPGIKIDGKVVTRENIKALEIDPTKSKPKPKSKKEYSREELKEMSFKELKKVGNALGTTDRSSSKLIKEILELQ